MRFYNAWSIFLEKSKSDLSLRNVWRRQYSHISIRIECADTFRILTGVNCVNESQICEIVNVYPILEYDHNFVLPQFDCFNDRPKTKFSDAFELVVIPQEYFVHGKFGMGPSAYQSQYVGPEKHLNDSDSSIEFSLKLIIKGIWVENLEAFTGATSKAAWVLVEAYEKYFFFASTGRLVGAWRTCVTLALSVDLLLIIFIHYFI